MSIPLYSPDMPAVRDPEIIPAVGEMYRHRRDGVIVKLVKLDRNEAIFEDTGFKWPFRYQTTLREFQRQYIHASAQEDE